MKYKVGDEVRIKGTDIGGTVESIIRGQLIVNSKGSKIPSWPEDVDLMKSVEEETVHNKWTGLKVELELSKTVIGISNVESLHGERFMSEFVKAIIPPEGYQFVDENGNVINATKIVLEKKKKEYPKTFEECVHVLEGENRMSLELMNTFRKLIDARNAYWTIYGIENGLGKPWEPTMETVYCISRNENVMKCSYRGGKSNVLEFPTAEMRDAFKENFDPDIKICKELL